MARILIVEDEALIAELLAMYIEEMGHESVGTAATVEQALLLLNREHPACAILDCSLGRQESTPIAEALAKAGIPFAFATGRGHDALPEGFKQRPMIAKPYIFEDVQRVLATMIS
ncbi:response regulator [Hyphomicrobium sp. 99]|uniref:response regulator n=1 Tax=Hyphomicrobium sp. 99 TaxID=1163419 RepID=UPI000697DC7C|nr:response regulator [Hyphomicrobium sp. 99]